MIRINLLPVRASKKRELGRQWLVLGALVLGAAVTGNYFWWADSERTLAAIKQRIARYQADIETLNKIIGEVSTIKEEKAQMEQKLGVLKKLRDGRTGPVRVMDELASVIPARVRLQAYEEKEGGVNLVGSGATHDDVAAFLRKLKGSRFFGDAQLKFTRVAGENRVEFNIVCSVKYST